MSLDLAALWDFGDPEISERRFRDALAQASGDDALILHTQIARTHGLRGDFDAARAALHAIAPAVTAAGAEARARHALELGRTHASARHAPERLTPEARALARTAFEQALTIAREAQLDALAIDAIHMFAFLDRAPAEQLAWGEQALALVLASSQPDARLWEASVRNNLGVALHALGRFSEALTQFEQALAIRERGTDAGATRVARWMVAWTQRAMGRIDAALAIQHRLEAECAGAGAPDPYVFEELAALYRAQGEDARAEQYQRLLASIRQR